MSAGAVFRYFADKREMIDAIIAVEVERDTPDFNRILGKDGRRWLPTSRPARRVDAFARPPCLSGQAASYLIR
ncbi:hypothetical protein [Burkholderia cenocepacia]|uniref:hypothetical protein n=1 Tax=Burkholderia cenocepacia TaxID=95486 RepID=UPI0021AB6000|nr:hypothetical protein [Burkholderia cenocepacia]